MKNANNTKNNLMRNGILWLTLIVVGFLVFNLILSQGPTVKKLTYNEYRQELLKKSFSEVAVQIDEGAATYLISGKYANVANQMFMTNAPAGPGSTVVADLQESGVKVNYEKMRGPSLWVGLISTLLPMVIVGGLVLWLLNRSQGGGGRVMGFGKSKVKLYNEESKKVSFDDVAGADSEKAELVEVVDFLKDSKRYTQMGARIPKGVLLVGPPGTGKTLLARAVAGEAKVPFLFLSGSDFVEMFVGVGASRVRDLFEQAKKLSPCIIFIDEIDAMGRQRGAGVGGGHDEREQTLNQLLVAMDGFDGNSGIIVMAATNRADILDPALLRPGRFDRQIYVTTPDVKGREAILEVHARNKKLAPEATLKSIAQRTTGFSGADLANVLNEASLLAVRNKKKAISMTELDEAIDRVMMGPQRLGRVISEKERKIVSYHEAGHVVVGYYLKDAYDVHKVTIIPRGKAAGYAMMLPKEDRYISTKQELLDSIAGLLGGRVAEEMIFNEVSTGASNDFERATDIARAMITDYGMSDKLATMVFGRSRGQVFLGRDFSSEQSYSDKIAYEIDIEMQEIIKQCYQRAKGILSSHRDKLELLAKTLMERETLVSEQIKHLLETGSAEGLDDAAFSDDKKDDTKQ